MAVLPAAAPEPMRDLLQHGTGRVVGTHRGGAYVRLDDGGVVVVEPADGIALPCALRLGLDTPQRPLADVRTGDVVRVADGLVHVGRLTVRVTRWEPARRPRRGVAPHRVAALSELLMAYDPPVTVDQPVVDLVGRGPGLTPAGDDVLAGMLVGLHHHPRLRGPVVADVTRSLHRTTALSAALLVAAADGRHLPALLRLADHLAGHGPDDDLGRLVPALTRIGHSSGTALAFGLERAARLAGPAEAAA